MSKKKTIVNKDDIVTVDIRFLNGQVNLILKALEFYSHNMEFMVSDMKLDNEDRQRTLSLVKYTYEVVLTSQAEQVNLKNESLDKKDGTIPFNKNINKLEKIIPNDPKIVAI